MLGNIIPENPVLLTLIQGCEFTEEIDMEWSGYVLYVDFFPVICHENLSNVTGEDFTSL